jgi:hypothetical protein
MEAVYQIIRNHSRVPDGETLIIVQTRQLRLLSEELRGVIDGVVHQVPAPENGVPVGTIQVNVGSDHSSVEQVGDWGTKPISKNV